MNQLAKPQRLQQRVAGPRQLGSPDGRGLNGDGVAEGVVEVAQEAAGVLDEVEMQSERIRVTPAWFRENCCTTVSASSTRFNELGFLCV